MGNGEMGTVLFLDLSGGATVEGLSEALSGLSEGDAGKTAGKPPFDAPKVLAASGVQDPSGALGKIAALLSCFDSAKIWRSPFPLPRGDFGATALLMGELVAGKAAQMDPLCVALMKEFEVCESFGPFTFERACGSSPRAYIGRAALAQAERLTVLEANIDDLSPEITATLIDLTMKAGALDAWLAPALMKKGRLASVFSALCPKGAVAEVREAVFRNSSSIGVREYEVSRHSLERRVESVQTPWGEVGVKVAFRGGEVLNVAPEFSDALAVSGRAGVPVKIVMAAATAAAFGKTGWKKG